MTTVLAPSHIQTGIPAAAAADADAQFALTAVTFEQGGRGRRRALSLLGVPPHPWIDISPYWYDIRNVQGRKERGEKEMERREGGNGK